MNIYFKIDVSQVQRNLKNMVKTTYWQTKDTLLQIQKLIIEQNIKNRLKSPLVSDYRDSSATESKLSGILREIGWNFNSGVKQVKKSIVIWTGDIQKLDTDDPIAMSIPRRSRKSRQGRIISLWRLLDVGTASKDYTITPRKAGSKLSFYFKRKGKKVTLPKVVHPGFKGRSYIFKDRGFVKGQQILWEGDVIAQEKFRKILSKHIDRFSAKL